MSLDYKAKEFRVKSDDQTKVVNNDFTSQYFSLELYAAADTATPVLSSSEKGTSTPASFINSFNGAKFEYGNILRVTHKEPQARLDIDLQGSDTATNNIVAMVNETATVTATVLPETADQSVTYTGNTAIVTIDTNGTWTVCGVGTASITVSTPNGKTAVIPVTVGELEPDLEPFLYYFGDHFGYYLPNTLTIRKSSVNIPNHRNQLAYSYIFGNDGDWLAVYSKDYYATSSNWLAVITNTLIVIPYDISLPFCYEL